MTLKNVTACSENWCETLSQCEEYWKDIEKFWFDIECEIYSQQTSSWLNDSEIEELRNISNK